MKLFRFCFIKDLLLYCTYSLWRKFNCVKIPQGEANKIRESLGQFWRQRWSSTTFFNQLLTCADQIYFILHDFAAYSAHDTSKISILKVPKCENFHRTDFFLFLHHNASTGRRLQGKNKKIKILIFRGSFGGFFFENYVLAQAECALKFFFSSQGKNFKCLRLHLDSFACYQKDIQKIFLDFQRTLSLRRQIVSAGSAGVGKLLAQAQPAQTICQRRLSVCVNLFPVFFQRTLSLRRQFFSAGSACAKKQNGEYLPQSSKKNKNLSSPQVTYPCRFIGVKKWVENLALGHL